MPKPKQNRGKPQFKPICAEQRDAYKLIRESTITFLTGPAGCTKSYTAMAYAIDRLLSDDDDIDSILLTRPAVDACGEDLGSLPGNGQEKISPYIHPMMQHVKDYAWEQRDVVRSSIEVMPLAHMRGANFKHCVAIMDEAQNANEEQLELFLTRLAEGSKMIVCGDPNQSDINNSPLMSVARSMSQRDEISLFEFSSKASIARHPLIPSIVEFFEERKHERARSMQGRR